MDGYIFQKTWAKQSLTRLASINVDKASWDLYGKKILIFLATSRVGRGENQIQRNIIEIWMTYFGGYFSRCRLKKFGYSIPWTNEMGSLGTKLINTDFSKNSLSKPPYQIGLSKFEIFLVITWNLHPEMFFQIYPLQLLGNKFLTKSLDIEKFCNVFSEYGSTWTWAENIFLSWAL